MKAPAREVGWRRRIVNTGVRRAIFGPKAYRVDGVGGSESDGGEGNAGAGDEVELDVASSALDEERLDGAGSSDFESLHAEVVGQRAIEKVSHVSWVSQGQVRDSAERGEQERAVALIFREGTFGRKKYSQINVANRQKH